MTWEVEYTDQFGEWWDTLQAEEQEAITVVPIADDLYDDHLREISTD
jgi:hypothetical protein